MKRLILIRHGETEANIKGLVCGQMDTLLSKNGRLQCESLRTSISKLSLRDFLIFSSPLVRAIESAKLIFGKDISLVLDDRLKETNTGIYSQLTFDELYQVAPHFKHEGDSFEVKYPEGESIQDLFNRHVSFLNEVMFKNYNDEMDVVIVGHGGTINSILHHVLKVPLNFYPAFSAKNATITEILLGPSPKLNLFNLGSQ